MHKAVEKPFLFLAKTMWKIYKLGFVVLSQLESNKTLQVSVHAIPKGNVSGLSFIQTFLLFSLF